MPISGHKESGVKPSAWKFSDVAAACVPIKKRRYPPLIRPSPPPSEEPCSITEEYELQRKQNSSTSQGSTLSNVSLASVPIKKRRFLYSLQASSPSLEETSPQEKSHAMKKEHSSSSLGSTLFTISAGLSDSIEDPAFEEKKSISDVTNVDMVQNSCSLIMPKQEESNPATPSHTLDIVNSKEKVMLNESSEKNPGSRTIKANVELLLAAKEGLALGIGADVSKQIVQNTVKQESHVVPASTNLSLSLKGHFFPSFASPEINEMHANVDKGEPFSLEYYLSKEDCSTHSSNTDAKSDSDNGTYVEKVYNEVSSNSEHVPLVTVAIPMVGTTTELTNPSLKHSFAVTKKETVDDHDVCMLKLMNEPLDPQDNSEQYIEDDDYEDGEVRESPEPSKVEDTLHEVREVEHHNSSNYDDKPVKKGVVVSGYPTSSCVVETDNITIIRNEITSEDGVDILMHEKPGKVIDKNMCVRESIDGEKSDIAADKTPINVFQRKLLDLSERIIVPETQETEHSDHASDGSHVKDVQCFDDVVKTTNTVRQTDLDLPKMEGSSNTKDTSKYVRNIGDQGRIIDLSRAASLSSPSKTRPFSGRLLPTRVGRDVMFDTLDSDKLYRGRDEVYIDAPHKISRGRHQDMSTRNSRLNFGRGRGRVNRRIRGDWEFEHEYSGEFYNGPSQQFHGARSKYSSPIFDTGLEYKNVGHDDSYVVNGRSCRKPLNDDSYIAPRRRSPRGGRDGIQMGHTNPRPANLNSRCIGGDGSELGGIKHSEKFMRGFTDDTVDLVYTCPQPFDRPDGRFSRGRGMRFSSMQRRGGLSQMRSKSPIRLRSRSPCQLSSLPRRAPRRTLDGFCGHPEITHRRSPSYRVERMGSPNDMRDIRDHGHSRSVISNSSPSGQILIRNNRRFDVVDAPDPTYNDDEYFDEEKKRFGESRSHLHSLRLPYINGNNAGENFHLNAEDRTRHYRVGLEMGHHLVGQET